MILRYRASINAKNFEEVIIMKRFGAAGIALVIFVIATMAMAQEKLNPPSLLPLMDLRKTGFPPKGADIKISDPKAFRGITVERYSASAEEWRDGVWVRMHYVFILIGADSKTGKPMVRVKYGKKQDFQIKFADVKVPVIEGSYKKPWIIKAQHGQLPGLE